VHLAIGDGSANMGTKGHVQNERKTNVRW